MLWPYSDYPVLKNGKAVLTSGTVAVKITSSPQLPIIKMGPHAEPNVIPRPANIPYVRWRIESDVPEDLKRFIRGRYWHRIETKLLAEALRTRGLEDAANAYERLLGNPAFSTTPTRTFYLPPTAG